MKDPEKAIALLRLIMNYCGYSAGALTAIAIACALLVAYIQVNIK